MSIWQLCCFENSKKKFLITCEIRDGTDNSRDGTELSREIPGMIKKPSGRDGTGKKSLFPGRDGTGRDPVPSLKLYSDGTGQKNPSRDGTGMENLPRERIGNKACCPFPSRESKVIPGIPESGNIDHN